MTPMHLPHESTATPKRWPPAWKVFACAVGAMALAVAVMAWHVTSNLGYRHPVQARYAETHRW